MKLDFTVRNESIYMDNATTTIMDDEVIEAMQPYLEERYGSQDVMFSLGDEAKEAIEEAKEHVARLLYVKQERIFFTSGGTEANNWAIKSSLVPACPVDSHQSVIECVKYKSGFIFPTMKDGKIDINALPEVFSNKVDLLSAQHASEELGTLQDISAIQKVCQTHDVLLHVDAQQSYGKIKTKLDADLVTVSAHKLHGPMGIGALYIKEGVSIPPLIHGHGDSMRGGSLPVPLIVGFGKAAELGWTAVNTQQTRIKKLRKKIVDELVIKYGAIVNGSEDGLANILSLTLPVSANFVMAVLDKFYSFCISAGNAERLSALGMTDDEIHRIVKVSLSKFNTDQHAECLTIGIATAIREAKEKRV